MDRIDVKVSITGNLLKAEVISEEELMVKGYKLHYYGVITKSVESNLKLCEFELGQQGIYAVSVDIETEGSSSRRYSFPVSYFTEETRGNFETYLQSKDSSYKSDYLPLYILEKPYSMLGIIYSKTDKIINFDAKNIDSRLYSESFVFGKKTNFYITSSKICGGGYNKFLFSGMANDNGKFIFGEDDVDPKDIFNFNDNIGNFSYIANNGKKIEIGNDYFGQSKIYYYENSNLFVASNSYHMLLLILKELKIKLDFNLDIIKATLGSNHYLIAQEIFCRESMIKGVKVLPINKIISITDKIRFVTTSIDGLMKIQPQEISHEQYISELRAAIDEVAENIDAVFKYHDKLDISFDLTGGLDSRMAFSVMTNIMGFNNKVKVRTLDIGEDLKVSTTIANIFNLEYDPSPVYSNSFNQALKDKTSFQMGGSYKVYPIKNELYYNPNAKLYIGGGCGEPMVRYYVAKDIYRSYMADISDLRYFTSEYIRQVSRESISYICDYNSSVKFLEGSLFNELSLTPGWDNMEKLDSLYLIYRSPLHFNQYKYVGNYWCPMQSKSLYKLFKKVFRIQEYHKLAFEVVSNANGILGALPYGNKGYNEDYQQLKHKLVLENEAYRDINILPDYDMTRKQEARKESARIANTLSDRYKLSKEEADKYNNVIPNAYNELIEYYLPRLSKMFNGELKELCMQLWFYINKVGNQNRALLWIWARVKTVIEQSDIIQ